MANLKKRMPQNVAGDFFVDSTCIDYRFEWVLPGHGQRVRLPADEMRRQILRLAESMRAG
ncbi:MAG TPA: hypothetical protein VGN42_01975 [Pirellulales bacterium]|jgi:hypothetical protein|nr:hypothetical protein [Pirellulales bacterium]